MPIKKNSKKVSCFSDIYNSLKSTNLQGHLHFWPKYACTPFFQQLHTFLETFFATRQHSTFCIDVHYCSWSCHCILMLSYQPQPTFHCDIIHRQLQTLASSDHLHSVPLIVIQLLPCEQHLWSFACYGGGEGIPNQTPQWGCCAQHVRPHTLAI